ncbi:ABC transporter ATP-binding protein [Polymorphum gilvum]|uniref:Oligopeptide/dipeptide ABC transporter, ATPase subunit n=1 Tax=Polymorphum gilvum (strain LMG 25793 / CGMCC 1.9160 / SL003B-26A1) TaxID=991905 RepID=F2J4I4_POLGS|nr:ABC transporter ATP-binding protein [Polymorphum gilvum]ADZ72237.1 Oligopeptide/dipeptide ABC transporter, ATPase subunit [Polymorphum gilvum SL003B-26A1]
MSQANLTPLLEVQGLRTAFPTRNGTVRAVDGVDLEVRPGECLGVVGESGSGKSVTFASVMGLVRSPGFIEAGSIRFAGRDLTRLSVPEMRQLRGRDIAMTMQDALTALNPALTVGEQIAEVLHAHAPDLPAGRFARRRAVRDRSIEMMRLVGIPSPESRLGNYPHEFSGGMRQRIMIAIALACRPKLLIADEPTTALDVTIQAQVLELIADIRRELGMSVVLITHDLGVVAEHCDRVMVMYAGQVVETGPTVQVITDPRHPYTQGLLRSIPRLSMRGQRIQPIEGQVPELIDLPPQCRFYSRCPQRLDTCRQVVAMRAAGPARQARCIRVGEEMQ